MGISIEMMKLYEGEMVENYLRLSVDLMIILLMIMTRMTLRSLGLMTDKSTHFYLWYILGISQVL